MKKERQRERGKRKTEREERERQRERGKRKTEREERERERKEWERGKNEKDECVLRVIEGRWKS